MFTGPDVSHHQGDVDWQKVAKHHELAIVRVSDGDVRDKFYNEARVKAVRKADLLLAPYYFARVASPQNKQRDGAEEAAMVLRFAKEGGWEWPGDLPLIYDFETDNGQPAAKCARHLLQFVRAYRTSEDHHPGIYTMPGFWERILPHLDAQERKTIAKCFLWQAEWGVESPRPLEPWSGPTLWQWTDQGRSSGISGPVDMNRSVVAEQRVLALAKRDKRPQSLNDEQPKPTPDHPDGVPNWVPKQHWEKWLRPWETAASGSAAFRQLCWKHGYLSPHFTRKEAACHDPDNAALPSSLRAKAQRQAFSLERLRHQLGDRALPVLSWYRTPEWNRRVGGAVNSRHKQADATDFTSQTVRGFGARRFDSACERVFADGGFGRYASGSRHGDSRGARARW
jgi:GH25 family lysozyme M1 (1,4-beta-N-acetylmuramidase)